MNDETNETNDLIRTSTSAVQFKKEQQNKLSKAKQIKEEQFRLKSKAKEQLNSFCKRLRFDFLSSYKQPINKPTYQPNNQPTNQQTPKSTLQKRRIAQW